MSYQIIAQIHDYRLSAERKISLFERIRDVSAEIQAYIQSEHRDTKKWRALVLKKDYLQAELEHCLEELNRLDSLIMAHIHTLRRYIVE